MSLANLAEEELYPSVRFSHLRDKKFRHNSISVNIIAPLCAKTATATAILPFLLRRGSAGFPDYTKLEQELCELYGASLGSDVIQYGGLQIIRCSITFVDDAYTIDAEQISGRCAALLGDIVLNPKLINGEFDHTDFELERQNLIDTIESEINDKRSYAIRKCKELLFEGSDLAAPRYGTVAQAKELTPAQAAARYTELMNTAQIDITFTGCGDPTAVRETFAKLFAGLKRHPAAYAMPTLPAAATKVRKKTQTMEVAQAKLVLGMRTGVLERSDDIDAMRLMTLLYGGTPNSKLFINVREKKSLCYYCAAHFNRPTGTVMVDIGVEHNNKEQAQQAIMEQLAAVAGGGFTDEELKEAKLAYANAVRSSQDSLSALESWYLTQLLDGERRSPEDEVAAMEKVTREAVCKAAAKVTLDSVYFLTGSREVVNE